MWCDTITVSITGEDLRLNYLENEAPWSPIRAEEIKRHKKGREKKMLWTYSRWSLHRHWHPQDDGGHLVRSVLPPQLYFVESDVILFTLFIYSLFFFLGRFGPQGRKPELPCKAQHWSCGMGRWTSTTKSSNIWRPSATRMSCSTVTSTSFGAGAMSLRAPPRSSDACPPSTSPAIITLIIIIRSARASQGHKTSRAGMDRQAFRSRSTSPRAAQVHTQVG